MKTVLPILGVLLCLIGAIWIGQGLNFIPGSFMTGQPFWAFAGLVSVVIGIGLIVLSRRGPRSAS